ncbi:MAG: cytidine deaminase [Hyphomicrobiales bacterium]|nr:cytidine deaminase [Hyphomicrobiales bacterium]
MHRARSATSQPKLGHSLKLLFDAALAARTQAYAPYSRFPVGAALRSREGAVFAGCNVENASYPLVTCAEAGAIAAMVAAGHKRVAEILIIGGAEKIVTPCGACRQRLREFATPEVLVHCMTPRGARTTYSVGALLPAAFGPEHLAQEA